MMYNSFDMFDDIVDALFNGTFNDAVYGSYKAPKTFKSITVGETIPKSNIVVNAKTKALKILVALPGLCEDNVVLNRDNEYLVLKIKKRETEKDWKYIQQSFEELNNEKTTKWKVDTKVYDLDTTTVSFDNGLMIISIEPLESQKPKFVSLFGKEEEKKEEKKKEKLTEEKVEE